MFMAVYRGGIKNDLGEFTEGRIYPARPEVDDPLVVDYEHFRVTDDRGVEVTVDQDCGLFEYPDTGYAVVLKPFGEYTPGDVVEVNDLDGGDFYAVKGKGFVRVENLQLLDEALLSSGAMAYNRESCRWERIREVEESMSVILDGGSRFELTALRFPVSDGELVLEPLVRCVDAGDSCGITAGKVYRVKGVSPEGWLVVTDDLEAEGTYPSSCFEFV
jgi:hypothetical protein